MKTKRKVGIWLRVSTKMQVKETDSLEHHQKRAEAYCVSKDWNIVKTYRVEAVSGKIVFNHPIMAEMLNDIKSGEIDTLIFSSLSRVAGSTKHLLAISEIFQKYDASMVSLKESIDTSSPAGRLFFTLTSALATFESEEISERVKASVPIRAKMGKALGGAAPFGFKWINDQMMLESNEALIRREIFEIFLQNKKMRTTAQILNDKGYRTRKGSKFSDSSVKRMLTDSIAKGLRRANYSQTDSGGSWSFKDESEWVYTKVPAIVDEEIFDKVNNIITLQHSTRKKPVRQPIHAFSGLVFCSCNNVKMRVKSSNPSKYTCPECKAKIPKEDLETIYKEQLKTFMLSPKKMAKYLSKANVVIQDKEKQLKILKDEQVKVNNQSKKFLDLYMDDAITKEGFARSNRPLDKRLNELEESIPQLEAEISLLNNQIMSEAEIHESSQNLYERWSGFSEQEKISVIRNLTDKITINKNEVEIKLHFIPSVINDTTFEKNFNS